MAETLQTTRDALASAKAEADAAGLSPVAADLQAAIAECDAAIGGGTVPPPSDLRYRSQQPYLLQHVRSRVEPNRVVGGSDWIQDGLNTQAIVRCQPTIGQSGSDIADHIDYRTGWAFDSKGKGGDIVDRDLVRNPATPNHWVSRPVNSVTLGGYRYTADATDAIRFIQQNGRWNAWSFGKTGTGVRTIAGKVTTSAPRIDVTYDDGSKQVLICRVTAQFGGSSAYPFTINNQNGVPEFPLPILCEFERPTQAVASATLTFTITTHDAKATTFFANVLDPPVNTDPVELGLAQQAGALDDGLDAVPGIINAHQYLDTLPESDFIAYTPTVGASLYSPDREENFSPDLIWSEHVGNPVPGPYLPDLTKYPHRTSPVGGRHKWTQVSETQKSQFHIVPSTYDKEGFEPLAPGVGAIRAYIPPVPGITDGFVEQSASYNTIQARIWLPAPAWGKRKIHTRYYWRLGMPQRIGDPLGPPDIPYRMPIAQRFQVFNSSGHWIFTDCAGKTGISPEQVTFYGGFSGTAGGGSGTEFRHSWNDFSSADDGPDAGGIAIGWHLFDYGPHNPPGYGMSGDGGSKTNWGQRGGIGAILYAGIWYCIETEVTLNEVRDANGNIIPPLPENQMRGGFLPNGELRVWIDGRLVFVRTGMVMRSLPYAYFVPSSANGGYDARSFVDPGYNKAGRRQCRDLGHIGMLYNKYHGGVTQNSVNRTEFISALAYADDYIGPMRFAA